MNFTATVENDTIKLPAGVHLPDGTEVTVEPRMAATGAKEEARGPGGEPLRHRDLDFLAGTWIEDSVFDEVLAEQRTINAEMWK